MCQCPSYSQETSYGIDWIECDNEDCPKKEEKKVKTEMMGRMTRRKAINNLNMISVAFVEPVTKEQRELIDDTFDMAIKALELLGTLTDRPCDVCKHRQENGCSEWSCVFDGNIG